MTALPDPHVEMIRAADYDVGGDFALPPMEVKRLKKGDSIEITPIFYQLYVKEQKFVGNADQGKSDYIALTYHFADDKDVVEFGDWEIREFYTFSEKAAFRRGQFKNMCANHDIDPATGTLEGKILRAKLKKRPYLNAEGEERKGLEIAFIKEWAKPKPTSVSPRYQQVSKSTTTEQLHDEIPF